VVSSFDAGTGKRLWQTHQVREFDSASPDFGTAMSPLVDAGLLVVHVGGNKSGALMALESSSGTPKWTWHADGPAYASPVIATIGGVRQIVTQSRSFVIGIEASTGRLLWRIPFTTEFAQNIVTPVVANDVVIYSGIAKPLAAVRIALKGTKWTTEPLWENAAVPMYMSSPVLAGGYLYGLTHRNRGQFFCVDAKTGKTTWTTKGREAENAAFAAVGDLLLVSTTEGELVIARQDPAKFDLVRRYTVAESPVWAHPVPAENGVLIKDAETLAYWTF
jgi:outer membrane protein assembly factor BamB